MSKGCITSHQLIASGVVAPWVGCDPVEPMPRRPPSTGASSEDLGGRRQVGPASPEFRGLFERMSQLQDAELVVGTADDL